MLCPSDGISEDDQANGANEEGKDERWKTVLGLVDVIVTLAKPTGEKISQRTGDRPGDHDADEAAKHEEAEIGGGEEVWRCGKQSRGECRDGDDTTLMLVSRFTIKYREPYTYPPRTTPYMIEAIKMPGISSNGKGSTKR